MREGPLMDAIERNGHPSHDLQTSQSLDNDANKGRHTSQRSLLSTFIKGPDFQRRVVTTCNESGVVR